MSKKPTKLIGLTVPAFESFLATGKELNLRPARLIPFYKPGDEMALTSILLSALRLVKEFRNQVFQTISLSRSNHILIYTEAEFLLFDKKRVDGLILVIRGIKIIDAVLIEVKNKNVELNEEQIRSYVNIAKEYGIPKLLTISNQFVSFPTQSPLNVRTPKSVLTYHLSWSFLLTIAHILLAENANNIAFKLSDSFVEETVSSWLQEERDMTLILSRELGLLVHSGYRKFKNDLSARIKYEKKELISKRQLESMLQIDGAASPLQIRACFDRKNIEMFSSLTPPQDKKTRGQISWIRNQLHRAEKKDQKLFSILAPDLLIEIHLKFVKHPIRLHVDELDVAVESIGAHEIKGFSILYLKCLGRKFESRKGVVVIIEKMLIDYYQGILQHLKRWEKPAPQLSKKVEEGEAT